jgi:hypothetical protein
MMNEILTIACASTFFFGVLLLIVFGFFGYLRYIRYRETLALAEKGLVKPQRNGGEGRGTLIWGIVITGLGLALCLGLYPLGFMLGAADFPLYFGPWMVIGLVPTFFGLALVLAYLITSRERKDEEKPVERNEMLDE